MTSDQKYEGKGNPNQNSEQTAQSDHYPGAHVSGNINHPPIPAHVLNKDIELKDSVALMHRTETHPSANVMLNAVYAAFALGLQAGAVDCSSLPTVTMPLTAVRDADHKQESSELEIVQCALTHYRSWVTGLTAYEIDLIDLLLEELNNDMHSLIGELHTQQQTGATK